MFYNLGFREFSRGFHTGVLCMLVLFNMLGYIIYDLHEKLGTFKHFFANIVNPMDFRLMIFAAFSSALNLKVKFIWLHSC